MNRSLVLLVATAILLAACGGESAAMFEGFDPEEVQALRDGADENGVEMDDETLLSSLRFGRDCRVWFAALDRADAGGNFVDETVEGLVDRANSEGNPELAGKYESILSSARLGDLNEARAWADGLGACAEVPRDAGS